METSTATKFVKPTTKVKMNQYEDVRQSVYYFLERPGNKIAIFYHLLNLVLIVGSIITSILSTIQSYENSDLLKDLILYYELSLLSWFTIEYVLRLWSCSFLGKYTGMWGKLKFMKTLYMMIDAFVIVSTLTTAILSIKTAYFTILRVTRFLQIFRILRLDRQRGDLRVMGRVVYKHRKELVTCYFVGFIILFGGTYLIYLVEKSSATNSTIDNMANGLYWAMITVTSVGYGDISPETWAGKLLTGIFALVGCAFFALPAGILGSGFALQVAKQKKQLRFIKVRNPAAVVIQTCWRNYAVMPHKYQLQGTWFYFLPQALGRANNPQFYQILPGVQEIFNSSTFPNKLLKKKKLEETRKRKWFSFFGNNSSNQPTKDGSLSNGGAEMRPTRKRRGSRFSGRKKSGADDMPLSTLLNNQYKEAIRFILRVKLFVAVKTFKNVRYPFVNVQDIMEKNALCHTETLSYLTSLQDSLQELRGEMKEIRLLLKSQQYQQTSKSSADIEGDDTIFMSAFQFTPDVENIEEGDEMADGGDVNNDLEVPSQPLNYDRVVNDDDIVITTSDDTSRE